MSSSNLRIIVIWYTLLVASLIDSTRTLQIFNGTLMDITCSTAALTAYHLVEQGIVYESYAELPELFDIEARSSPTKNNVTLYINGTNRSNNVTVICGYIDLFVGTSFNILFTVTLEFVGLLPAPNDVHYTMIKDPPGYLQILWEPPILDSDGLDLQNISIRRDARIIRYTIYITTEEPTIVQIYNALGTSLTIGIDKIPCSFWFQVAAVNPAGVGERSPPQNLIFDPHTRCMSSTVIEAIPASSGSAGDHDELLNYYTWAISATTIAALLAVVCIILAACLFTLLKMYHNGINRHSKTAEKEIEMKQNEVYGINTRPLR